MNKNLDYALTVNLTRGLHMTADIVFSLIISQLSELISHTKRITSETPPEPLSAVPRIIENTKKKRRCFTSKPELRFISFEKLVDCDEFSGIGTTTGTTNSSEVS